jgi:hypothetical protein
MELKEIKEAYGKYEKKYGLPDYKEINGVFELDKIDKESDMMLRIFRKVMMDKVLNSLGFFDMIFNPVNAPRIYMPSIKALTEGDKKIMEDFYKVWGDLSLEVLALEVRYDEKAEAKMVKKIYDGWKGIEERFSKLMNKFARPEAVKKKSRGYFG